jgi:hypothetical protein
VRSISNDESWCANPFRISGGGADCGQELPGVFDSTGQHAVAAIA